MTGSSQLQNVRALYVDDVAANRRYLKALLDKIGLLTEVAEDGPRGLALWETERHPLVLLDVHMPGMDGAEVARRIRLLQEPTENVVILGITADMSETLRESLQMAGMDDCIEKPTNPQVLLDALTPWVGTSADKNEKEDHHQNILYEDSELVGQLLTELPKDMARLEAAFVNDDLVQARAISHQLSGVAALYRLLNLRDALYELEQQLRISAPLNDELLRPVAEALAEDLAELQMAQLG